MSQGQALVEDGNQVGQSCNNNEGIWAISDKADGELCCGGGAYECKSGSCNASESTIGVCFRKAFSLNIGDSCNLSDPMWQESPGREGNPCCVGVDGGCENGLECSGETGMVSQCAPIQQNVPDRVVTPKAFPYGIGDNCAISGVDWVGKNSFEGGGCCVGASNTCSKGLTCQGGSIGSIGVCSSQVLDDMNSNKPIPTSTPPSTPPVTFGNSAVRNQLCDAEIGGQADGQFKSGDACCVGGDQCNDTLECVGENQNRFGTCQQLGTSNAIVGNTEVSQESTESECSDDSVTDDCKGKPVGFSFNVIEEAALATVTKTCFPIVADSDVCRGFPPLSLVATNTTRQVVDIAVSVNTNTQTNSGPPEGYSKCDGVCSIVLVDEECKNFSFAYSNPKETDGGYQYIEKTICRGNTLGLPAVSCAELGADNGECFMKTAMNFLSPNQILFQSAKAQNIEDQTILDPGVYEISADNITKKSYEITSESRIRYFNDENNDGEKQEGEEYIEDLKSIEPEIIKVSDIFYYNFSTGWTIVHFPLVMKGQETSKVTRASDLINLTRTNGGNVSHVGTYRDGEFVIYSIRSDNKGNKVEYGQDFNILPGEGYFVKNLGAPIRMELRGHKIKDSLSVLLNNGWNLVGIYNANTSRFDVFEILAEMKEQGLEADVISTWESGMYRNAVVKDGVNYGVTFDLLPERGYWVRVDGEGVKTFRP